MDLDLLLRLLLSDRHCCCAVSVVTAFRRMRLEGTLLYGFCMGGNKYMIHGTTSICKHTKISSVYERGRGAVV